jgi:hypothetical protein
MRVASRLQGTATVSRRIPTVSRRIPTVSRRIPVVRSVPAPAVLLAG